MLAVDPGRKGGIALLHKDGRVLAWPVPNSKDGIDEERIWNLFQDKIKPLVDPSDFAIIELVWSRPFFNPRNPRQRQSPKSSFTFGLVTGWLRAGIRSVGLYPFEISPREWQTELGCLTKGDKDVTKGLAQTLFGNQLRITNGVADALLIAEYARRTF